MHDITVPTRQYSGCSINNIAAVRETVFKNPKTSILQKDLSLQAYKEIS